MRGVGDGCPAGWPGHLTDLGRMIDAIEDGSWTHYFDHDEIYVQLAGIN
jgi:hypothetical protein